MLFLSKLWAKIGKDIRFDMSLRLALTPRNLRSGANPSNCRISWNPCSIASKLRIALGQKNKSLLLCSYQDLPHVHEKYLHRFTHKKPTQFPSKIHWQKHLDESDSSNSAGCRWWKLRRLLHPCEVRDCKPTELFHKAWCGRCHPRKSPSMQTLDLKNRIWKHFSKPCTFTHITHLTILPCHNDFTAQV